MKHLVLAALALTALSAPAQAGISAFSCKAVIVEPRLPGTPGKTYRCQVSVEPIAHATSSKPPSIDTSRLAGNFSISCERAGPGPLNQKVALYDEYDNSQDEISDLKEELVDPALARYGKLALDPARIVTMRQYDAPIGTSVFVYGIGETKDAAGNVSGHVVSFSNGLMLGCLE